MSRPTPVSYSILGRSVAESSSHRQPSDNLEELQGQLLRELNLLREGQTEEPEFFRTYLQHAQILAWRGVADGYMLAAREVLSCLRSAQPFIGQFMPDMEPKAAAAAETYFVSQSLYLAAEALEERRVADRISETERAILQVLAENQGTYLRRGEVHKLLNPSKRPTPPRVGQILVELHGESLVLRIHGRTQGNPSAAFYTLSSSGLELCRSLGLIEAVELEQASPPLFEQHAPQEKDAEFNLDYISSLSHQLLTPLGSLIETLRNFERGELNQRYLQQRLPYVIGQVVVCTRLIRNLTYMDKILRGEPFQMERVSLAKLSIETKLDFLHLLAEKHLDLHIDDASLLNVQGHPEMLRQVLVNLTDNAIKYSFPGSSIQIGGRKVSGAFALEVSNQGLPIPSEDREKVFQRGYRTNTARGAVPHGTGLGLWLVRKIVDAHGASIHCLEVMKDGKKRILFRIVFPISSVYPRRSP